MTDTRSLRGKLAATGAVGCPAILHGGSSGIRRLASWPLSCTRQRSCKGVFPVKELVEYMAKLLVDNPDQVEVTEVNATRSVILELRVAKEDMGRVIGKRGRVANAMRTLLRVAAAKEGKRAILEIV